MQKEIGGYLSLEIGPQKKKLHSDGVFVNSGRHAIEYLLRTIKKIESIWIPYYTCRVVLEPINKLGISVKRYSINKNFELSEDIHLGPYDYILITNYFGIKDEYVRAMAEKYKDHIIVDNAHALFMPPLDQSMTAYSPRKTIGVADGGIAFSPTPYIGPAMETDISFERSMFLLKRYDLGSAAGYADSKACNKSIENQPLKAMSPLTTALYNSTDFDYVQKIRRENFNLLNKALNDLNGINIPNINSFACPLIYPFYYKDSSIRQFLISHNVFVAVYWPYVKEIAPKESVELNLMEHIIALPIDQRYGKDEMSYIVSLINQFVAGNV